MAESGEGGLLQRKFTRRGFLTFAAGTALVGSGVISAFDDWPRVKAWLGRLELPLTSLMGTYSIEKVGSINDLAQFVGFVEKKYHQLPGLSGARVWVSNGREAAEVALGKGKEELFVPASVVKLIVCQEIFRADKDCFREDLAWRIFNRSEPIDELVINYAKRNKLDVDVGKVVREILYKAGITQVEGGGDRPLMVSFGQMRNYFASHETPMEILRPMSQEHEPFAANYGIPRILQALEECKCYFKIGLYGETNSYLFVLQNKRTGERTTVFGYAIGPDDRSVHTQMLWTAGALVSLGNRMVISG